MSNRIAIDSNTWPPCPYPHTQVRCFARNAANKREVYWTVVVTGFGAIPLAVDEHKTLACQPGRDLDVDLIQVRDPGAFKPPIVACSNDGAAGIRDKHRLHRLRPGHASD